MTNITIDKLKKMTDAQIIHHGKMHPFICQWENKDALKWFMYHMALMQGRNYQRTGKLKSFQGVR